MGKALAALDAVDRAEGRPRLRAVVYLRVSTEEQTEGYGLTYGEKRCMSYIERNGWEHVGIYKDPGVSGSLKAADRPDLKRLMGDAAGKTFDVVVVPEGRVIGRTDRAYYSWVWELEDQGIYVADAKSGIDNTTEQGKDAMREEANYAFKEYTRIRTRTQNGIQEKAQDGLFSGGKAKYGYRIHNQGKKGLSRLVLDECDGRQACVVKDGQCTTVHETRVLRTARELVVGREGDWHAVATALNDAGLPTRSGKPWTGGHLRLIVMNEDLLNARVVFRSERRAKKDREGKPLHGESVTIPLDPVFTEDEVAALKAAVRPRRRKTVRREAFILTERINSPCGSCYVGRNQHYVCRASTNGGSGCGCPQVPADQTEAWVWGEVRTLLGDAERLKALADEWVGLTAGNKANYLERIAELDQRIEEQDAAIAVTMAVAAQQAARRGLTGRDAEAAVIRTIAPLSAEIEKLTKARADVTAWQQEAQQAGQRARDLQALAETAQHHLDGFTARQRADFLGLLNIRVTVKGPRSTPSTRGNVVLPPMHMEGDIRPGLLGTTGHTGGVYPRESTSHVTFRFSMALTA